MKSNYEIATVTNLKKYCMDIRLEALNNRQAGRKKVYFAGPWFDKKAKLLLKTIKYICEVTTLSIYDIVFPDEYNFDLPSKTYKNNIDLITACDVVIANIASKDVGTAYEIGYAKALGKQIVLLGLDETCFEKTTNIMLAFAADKCIILKDLQDFLLGKCKNFIKIVDSWENKE